MATVYAVDTEKTVTPVMVRDAIIRCFLVHGEILEGMEEYADQVKNGVRGDKELDVEIHIKKLFEGVGGDFENPTKERIIKVCDRLAEFSEGPG